VANAGLKVVGFSAICRGLVRVAGKGVRERKLTAESSQHIDGKKEKDNLETLSTERGRVPKWEAEAGWKPKFTVYDTAFLISCQVISYVVMIRIAGAWGVS
jgi:hypothetical protein